MLGFDHSHFWVHEFNEVLNLLEHIWRFRKATHKEDIL
jgi:hypothetical protein